MPERLFCLHYDYVEDILERRRPHREAHLARVREWHAGGRIVLAGAVGDPPGGALIVFRVPDAADVESFVAADPYVDAGLVVAHRVSSWTEVTCDL